MTTTSAWTAWSPSPRYELATETGEWLQTLADAGSLPSGTAATLLDAAWDAGLLTGPYRPGFVSQRDRKHRIVLDLGDLNLCTPPRPPGGIHTNDETRAALAFLRDVTEQATHLLQQWTRHTSTSAVIRRTDPQAEPGASAGSAAEADADRDRNEVRLDRISHAYYGGVGAGANAAKAVNDITTNSEAGSDEWARRAYFWLAVGARLHALLPDANPQEQEAFVQGAAMREPEPDLPILQVTIDKSPLTASTASQHPEGDGDVSGDVSGDASGPEEIDEDDWFEQLGAALARVALDVRHGAIYGQVTTGDNGAVIGTFHVRAPE